MQAFHQDQNYLVGLLNKGINISISNGNLTPLIRSIEIALEIYRHKTTNISNSIYSFDSFCEPHLEAQLRLYEVVSSQDQSIKFCNLPIGHYVTSLSDPGLLIWQISQRT